ncbi:MAG: UDP-N-acetylglucosamine 2-epimerase (non-hydrolyzing) [Anaerolineales bacterium]
MSSKNDLTLVVGARPNFMKAAPLWRALQNDGRATVRLIHTGQHFDENMSKVFFEQLGLPKPDADLNIHTGTPANQIAQVITALGDEFTGYRPRMVVVFGDVNSTLAAAIAANKMNLPLAHVEAGLRSFDRSMPEEHNRKVTDMLADFLFTPSEDADQNLLNEGIDNGRIYRVGNIMVDSLVGFRDQAAELDTYLTMGVEKRSYALVTLHRPSNVDQIPVLKEILAALGDIGREMPVLFPVHPRTRKIIDSLAFDSQKSGQRIMLLEPLGYFDFLNLMINARLVLTDSGGIQEETTVLGVSCLTLRDNTERPITIKQGTNQLVGNKRKGIVDGFHRALDRGSVLSRVPPLWDGKTADRITAILAKAIT